MCPIFSFIIICSVVVTTFGEEWSEDTSFKCNESRPTINAINVFGAFRLKHYIGLLAELTQPNGGGGDLRAFRILYQGFGDLENDPSTTTTTSPHVGPPSYPFSDFKRFQGDERNYTKGTPKEDIFAFSTDSISVLQNLEKGSNDMVYFNTSQGVEAWEVDVAERRLSTIKKLRIGVIYKHDDPSTTYESQDLNLNFMFAYFPPEIKITAIMIAEKPKGMYKNPDRHGSGHPEYLAVIYTYLFRDGKEYQFRQRLIAEPIDSDNNVLKWEFDEKNRYCDETHINITGAVFLHSYSPKVTQSDDTFDIFDSKDIFFLEFSKNKHRYMKMHFNTVSGELDIEPITVFQNEEWIDNTKLMDCRKDSFNWDYHQIPCGTDYPQYLYDEIPGIDKVERGLNESTGDKDSWTGFWLMVGCLVLALAVLAVVAVGVFTYACSPTESD